MLNIIRGIHLPQYNYRNVIKSIKISILDAKVPEENGGLSSLLEHRENTEISNILEVLRELSNLHCLELRSSIVVTSSFIDAVFRYVVPRLHSLSTLRLIGGSQITMSEDILDMFLDHISRPNSRLATCTLQLHNLDKTQRKKSLPSYHKVSYHKVVVPTTSLRIMTKMSTKRIQILIKVIKYLIFYLYCYAYVVH